MSYDVEILGAVYHKQDIIDEYTLNQDFFITSKYKMIFEILNGIHQSGKDITDIMVVNKVKGTQVTFSEILDIESKFISAANIEWYITEQIKIIQTERLRKLGLIINDYVKEKDIEEAIELVQNKISDINVGRSRRLTTIQECVNPAIEQIEKYYNSKGEISGVTSGYPDIDDMTSGFQPEDLIVVGARPSVGKTAFALAMAARISDKNNCVGFFSCEMSKELITQRQIASEARLGIIAIRSGRLRPSDFHNLTTAAGKIYQRDILIDDTPNIKFSDLRSTARIMARKGARIIFIDYFTLIRYHDMRLPKNQQVAEISRGLKQLARELKIPIIALSQVKRDADGRAPRAADLKWCSEIEDDSDLIMLLHRPNMEMETELIFAKNSNGPCGVVKLHFIKEYMRFDEISYADRA